MSKIQTLSAYALIAALEQDLRTIISEGLIALENPLTEAETRQASIRFISDKGKEVQAPKWTDLLNYLDLSQEIDLINRHEKVLTSFFATSKNDFQKISLWLRKLAPIRNDIAHSRIVTIDKYDVLTQIIKELLTLHSGIGYTRLKDEWNKLKENPEHVLAFSIPSWWQISASPTRNNLPIPDFQDTGFVGRETDRENLMNLLLGAHPLITVTGEGGVGKTSLTLKCLDDIVNHKTKSQFDIVYWTSLKTNRLTPSGIQEITGAMYNEMQVLQDISEGLKDLRESKDGDLFNNVIRILDEIPTLLVIDNLETIDRDALRPLFIRIPRQSKILLTSRVAIGEIEIAYALQPMKAGDATDLLRRTARLLNGKELLELEKEKIATICAKLFFNPLAIKWFVQSYIEGRLSLSDLLNHQGKLIEVMEFCFSNLYDTLSSQRKKQLRILVDVGKPLSEVQLALLSGENDIEKIRIDLRYLVASNLLKRSRDTWGKGESTLWSVGDFAQKFISSREKLLDEKLKLQAEYHQIIKSNDEARKFTMINPFRSRSIQARTTDEAMIVSLLHKALEASYEKKHPLALKYADTACKLLPDFYEVWRVSAQIKDEAGKIIEARDDFEKALDFADGKSEPLLAHYAKFLQKHDQIDKAIQILSEKALSPSAQPELVIALAWTQTLNKDYKNAIQLFETVYKKIESVSGDQRSFILVQYATALRLAAENERNRKNPDKGFDLIFQSLSVIKELCNSYSVNSAILSTVQKSFKETCRILAMKHVDENWTRLEPVALELSKYILLFDKNEPETRLLHEVYPEIKAKDSFQQILSPTGILKKNEILGTLTRVFVNKDFAYLKGENGQEYFMHQSELKSNIKWDKFNELKNIRIKFTEQALNPKNSATWKKRKYILPRAKSVFLLATIIDSTEDDGD